MTQISTKPRKPRKMPVPKVELPPEKNSLDAVVNALAEAWNTQNQDSAAEVFFNTPLVYQRQQIITNSLYRFSDELDQQFMARQLDTLARAILGGCFRWTS